MNLCHLFDLSLQGRRDQSRSSSAAVCLRSANSTRAVIALRACLRREAFSAGDRLCVYLANSVEMIDLYLACVKLGVIFVPINILYRDREISHILADAAPRALIADAAIATDIPVWKPADLTRDAMRCERQQAKPPSGWRRPGGHHLYLRHHGSVQRRDRHSEQLRLQRRQPHGLLGDLRRTIGFCSRCRFSTSTGSATGCIAG